MKKASSIIENLETNNDIYDNLVDNKILKDKYIINFINKNNLTKDVFEKNIQTFYEYYTFKKNMKNIGIKPKLKYDLGVVSIEFTETEEQKRLNYTNKFANRIKTEYVPKSILFSTFSNLTTHDEKLRVATNIIKLCDEKLNNKENVRGIYLYGKTGIGKSYLMGCIYNYFKDNGIEPAIIYFPEFARKMKAEINSGEYSNIIDKIREQEILIIDDIGAENITEFVRDEILVPIVNYRSAEKLLTFFTSNFSISDLSSVLSATKNTIDETKAVRILDRIRYLATPIYLDSVNEREIY